MLHICKFYMQVLVSGDPFPIFHVVKTVYIGAYGFFFSNKNVFEVLQNI